MERPNILLITVDCLRADHLSCYGYERLTTPVLDGIFRREGYRIYRNHMTNGPNTQNSFPSIMCSRNRLEMPGLFIPRKWTTISQMLRMSGYHTVGIASSNPWTTRYFGYHRGFVDFEDYIQRSSIDGLFGLFQAGDWSKFERFVRNIYDILDGNTMRAKKEQDMRFQKDAMKRLEELDKEPWFMWIHYMNAHSPYVPMDDVDIFVRFVNKMVTMDRSVAKIFTSKAMEMYDRSIHDIDENLGSIIKNVSDETMVIITSDHGEGFNEHGFWEHHFNAMYQECLGIPLVIKYPCDVDVDYSTEFPSSSVDIMPTISEVIDGYSPPVMRGLSLLSDVDILKDRPVFHEGVDNLGAFDKRNELTSCSVTYDGIRLVKDGVSGGTRMFDLSTDHMERRDVSSEREYRSSFNELSRLMEGMRKNENRTTVLEFGRGYDGYR